MIYRSMIYQSRKLIAASYIYISMAYFRSIDPRLTIKIKSICHALNRTNITGHTIMILQTHLYYNENEADPLYPFFLSLQ